ncbi:MAG: hypothetical protein J6A42_02595 [Firmicutes bacterium]|nr:hypothetical protein [Bacillota bacterium]
MSKKYSMAIRVQVAKEASQPELQGLEHVIAEKYGIKPWTVRKWRDIYLDQGEDGLRKGHVNPPKKSKREIELEKENAALKEEVQILKKAAAFLADLRRE